MNRIYRLIWSRVLNTWVAVSEITRGRGKSGSAAKSIVGALILLSPMAMAAPTGGQISAGSGSIAKAGVNTTITQNSQNLAINWQSFNIAANETVNFQQPSATAIAVNRIFDTNGTQILGHLNANGQVWLINPNGILFGQSAQVNVGGLVASTLDISNNSNGVVSFAGNGSGSIINQGTITAANGGYVAFIGNTVSNTGSIAAHLGSVALGAGNAVTLTFAGNSLVKMQVDMSVLNSLAQNGGLIQADGGMVILTAGAKDALLASVVNNTGKIEARTVENHNGTITLLGGMTAGTVNVGGTLDASAPANPQSSILHSSLRSPQSNGGVIETSAAHVKVADGAKITTASSMGLAGTWLIDPIDFTIGSAAAGTVTAGTPSGDISGATLSTALGLGAVTILSSQGSTVAGSGNINVNDAVSWSANTLTLTAANNINVNAVMTATGAASLAMNPATTNGADAAVAGGTVNMALGSGGFTGRIDFNTTGSLSIGGITYTVINSAGVQGDAAVAPATPSLQGMAATANLAGHFVLGSNIDASATGLGAWYAAGGFAPVGTSAANRFTGTFDGLGHTINNLTINRATTYVGLFGAVNGTVRNVGLLGGSVTGSSYTGGLAGRNFGTISNSYSTGNVSGASYTGGLVGNTDYGSISNSYATGTVSGTGYSAGGLVGGSIYGTVSNSYATGTVTGNKNVGGLVGNNRNSNTVSNSYATGQVTGAQYAGGLVGTDSGSGAINTSYSTGKVTAPLNVGGLLGIGNAAKVTNSFWDITTSTQAASAGGTGLTTALMKQQGSFIPAGTIAGQWDFTTPLWRVNPAVNNGYLCLAAFSNCIAATSTTIYLDLISGSSTYGNTPSLSYGYYTTAVGGVAVTDASPTGTVIWSNPLSATSNVGTYSEAYVGGITLGNSSYLLSAGNAMNWTVNKAQLTVAANNQTRTYGAANPTFNETVSGFVNGENASVVSGSATGTSTATSSTGVGSATITGSIGSLTASNYSFVAANGTLTINPATLTVTANNQNMTYGGTMPTLTASYSGFVNGDSSASLATAPGLSSATATTANAGTYTGTLTAGGAVDNNYKISYATGNLTIGKANATITANSGSATYNGLSHSVSGFTASGLVNGETVSVLTGVTASGSGTNAGSYSVIAGGTDSNYNLTLNNGTLTIGKANATITANNASKTYGQTATFTGTAFSFSGLQNGETIGSVTEISAGSAATVAVGHYAIVAGNAAGGTFNPSNYMIGYVDGALTVTASNANAVSMIDQVGSAKKIADITPSDEHLEIINGGIRLPSQNIALISETIADHSASAPPSPPASSPPGTDKTERKAATEQPPGNLAKSKPPQKVKGGVCTASNGSTQILCVKKAEHQKTGHKKAVIKPVTTGSVPRELQSTAGDALAESFHEMPWTDNSGINNVARSHSDKQYATALRGASVMSNPIFFIFP